jgi:hypothetical protein
MNTSSISQLPYSFPPPNINVMIPLINIEDEAIKLNKQGYTIVSTCMMNDKILLTCSYLMNNLISDSEKDAERLNRFHRNNESAPMSGSFSDSLTDLANESMSSDSIK